MSESLSSPDGALTTTIRNDGTDGVHLDLTYRGEDVLVISGLGLIEGVTPAPAEIVIANRSDRTVEEAYRATSGKRLERTHRADQATFQLDVGGTRVDLDVRVSNDGVAYRHRFHAPADTTVTAEGATFSVPQRGTAWLTEYQPNNEGVWRGAASVGGVPTGTSLGFPALFETPGGCWCLVSESAVDATFAGSHLRAAGEGSFALALPEDGVPIEGEWTSPWRVAIVGDLSDVVASTLVDDLNPASVLEDTSWVRPGRVAWSWWSEFYSPRDLDRQREYVDYASARGWEFTLVDARWDPEWLPGLVDYARERHVGIIIWAHWTDLATQEQRDELLPRWSGWGVAGIKVDFMDSETRDQMAWYEALAADAARHRLMVNYHGSTVPKGRQRTWPHVMTYEGILGAEHYVRAAHPENGYLVPWRDGPDPVHNTTVPFTRNVIGPMDYTPVVFSAPRRATTAAHELAQSVVFESGWQHFADSIEAYAARPAAEQFLTAVPAAWDETRLLAGRPGELVVMARRRGTTWWIGCLSAGAPRVVDVPLDFLDATTPYDLRLIEDPPRTGWEENPRTLAPGDELTESASSTDPGETLTLALRSDGGFAAVLEPVR